MTKSIFYCRNGSVSIFIHWPEFCGTLSYLMAAQTYIHPRFIPRFSILCFEICIICENSCIKWRGAWSSSCQTSHWNSALLCLTLLMFPHSDSTLGILELPWGSPLLAQHFQGEGKLKGRWMRTPVQEFPREEHEGSRFCQCWWKASPTPSHLTASSIAPVKHCLFFWRKNVVELQV